MFRNLRTVLIGAVCAIIATACLFVRADYTATQGSGTSVFALTLAGKVMPAFVPVTSDGTAIQSGNPLATTVVSAIGVSDGTSTASSTGSLIMASVNGTNRFIQADPCQIVAATYTNINISTSGTTRIIAPATGKKTYICSIDIFTFTANNIAVIEGTGGTCGSSTFGIIGGTTSATGISFPAQGGLAKGNGMSAVYATSGTNVDFCIVTGNVAQLSGTVKWVQQ